MRHKNMSKKRVQRRRYVTDMCDFCNVEFTTRRDTNRRPGKGGRAFCSRACKNKWMGARTTNPDSLPLSHMKCNNCRVLVLKDPIEDFRGKFIFCGGECEKFFLANKVRKSPEQRFWQYVNKDPEFRGPWGDCWGWEGSTDMGYARFGLKGKATYAHIYSYFLATGYMPDFKGKKEIIMHSCDNPPCTNPEHLKLGTQADNVADKVAKNRHAKGDQNGKSKLSSDKVYLCRLLYKGFPTLYSCEKLAEIFGMSSVAMDAAIRGNNVWGHVPHITNQEISELLFKEPPQIHLDFNKFNAL